VKLIVIICVAGLMIKIAVMSKCRAELPESAEECQAKRASCVQSMITRAGVVPTLTNSLGMVFVHIPRSDTLFCMWDTCVWEYSVFARSNNYIDESWKSPGFAQECTHPVVNVPWRDAKAFCDWLTQQEKDSGRIKSGQYYRLPTDSEWSKAVGLQEAEKGTPSSRRAVKELVYPWGKEWPPPEGVGNYSSIYKCDSYDYTSPVGSFSPNRFGLYDMGGNVGQWCEDWYITPEYGCRTWRNCGTWYSDGTEMLALSSRCCNAPDAPYNALGFRVVLASNHFRPTRVGS
jgi:formylglycine-generating enzyme required for sulfatase activity